MVLLELIRERGFIDRELNGNAWVLPGTPILKRQFLRVPETCQITPSGDSLFDNTSRTYACVI